MPRAAGASYWPATAATTAPSCTRCGRRGSTAGRHARAGSRGAARSRSSRYRKRRSGRGSGPAADAQLGMTPATYGRGGTGTRIAFAIVPCALGRLLVAATARGICRVAIGDDAPALERGLRAELPAATIACDDDTLRSWVAEITAHLDGRQPHLDLPVDVRATAFQRRVWEALRKMPYGSTRSYSAIART